MSESDEKRELGGLARSIDALFSQGGSAPVAEDSEKRAPVAPEVEEEAPVTGAASGGDASLADPFESFDAHAVDVEAPDAPAQSPDSADERMSGPLPLPDTAAEPSPTVPPLPDMSDRPTPPPLPDVAAAPEVTPPALTPPPLPETADEPTSGPPALPDIAAEPAPTPPPLPELGAEVSEASESDTVPAMELDSAHPQEPAPETEAEPEAAPDELAEAVEHFLSGHPGAGAEVQSIAARLRDRLALDPLADAVERLVHASDGGDDDPALDMAAKIANPAVASRLVQRMASEEDESRRAEYVVLAERLGIVMANAFKGALTDAPDARTRRACHQGLIAMGDISRPVIEAMVEDDNRFLVQSGVAILGEIGGDGALELVTSALANTDFRVRREAIAALAKLGDDDSVQLVMASLEDPDPTVRAAAAEVAGRLGIDRALRPILSLLDDEDLEDDVKVQVHTQALRALGHLGDPGAVQAIEKRAVGSLFSKPTTEVRVAAYQALYAIGTPHARQVIEKARDDKDPVVRTTVRAFSSDQAAG
ncbi:MAG: HEAT repeat domain-containing protein [Gemmatimonadota bacterium]|jgi:HEAT repeat protein